MQKLRLVCSDSERHLATPWDKRDRKIHQKTIEGTVRDTQKLHGTGSTVRKGQQP